MQEAAYKILADTEKDGDKKAKLQERAAAFRLESLKQSQALEQKILDLQLEQEQVQNRVAIIKAKAGLTKAQAEEQKVKLNPESTDAERQAAGLGVTASALELGSLSESAALQDKLATTRRQQVKIEGDKAQLGARLDLANVRTNPGQKEREINLLRRESSKILVAPPVPIGNRTQPDYSQVDSAAVQLGLQPKDAKLGRFIPPMPVDLHSGIGSQITQIASLSEELRMMASLTQSGVVGNLIKLVEQNKTLSGQLLGLANRPQVVQNINNKTTKRAPEAGFAGLPL